MTAFTDLSRRNCEPEIMDDPELDAVSHVHALDSLARLNWWSGSARLLWSPIEQLARSRGLEQISVLDVATGAGDLPLQLWRRARRAGFNLQLCGVDVSPRAVEAARQRAAAAGAAIDFRLLDVLCDPLPTGFDVICSSLFLHHLADERARHLLAEMRDAARRLVVVSDLERSRRGLWLVELAVRVLTRSPVVHVDGPLSVRAAFSVAEVQQMVDDLGMRDSVIRRRWPNRLVLTWQPPQER